MHAARADFAAIARKVAKVEAPKSMRASQRSLERYFSLTGESFVMLLTMIDSGAIDRADFEEAQEKFQKAQEAYSDWRTDLSNRYIVVVGNPCPSMCTNEGAGSGAAHPPPLFTAGTSRVRRPLLSRRSPGSQPRTRRR